MGYAGLGYADWWYCHLREDGGPQKDHGVIASATKKDEDEGEDGHRDHKRSWPDFVQNWAVSEGFLIFAALLDLLQLNFHSWVTSTS